MLLKSVTLSGFKSFRKRAELPLSDRTTVLIGPNDHGKTNVLMALEKLDSAKPFDAAEINDRVEGTDSAYISYRLGLSESELHRLFESVFELPTAKVDTTGSTIAVSASDSIVANFAVESPLETWRTRLKAQPEVEIIRQPGKPPQIKLDDVPEAHRATVSTALMKSLPKVTLFTLESLRQLPDTVDLAGLQKNEVMQGVFRLAGIWKDRERLLSGNTRKNQDDLREASKTLTERIQQNWTQGRDLQFYLEYVANNIRLTVKDTASTVTAVGERSEGFTAYFAMRMLLVARTDTAQPNGYVFMFDEPGLNLHPKGQVDLQNVFEDISRTNQIIYSTHSVFLINKNYPDRNHLIFKNSEGSNIDNKPFVGGWAKVKEHLGLYLSSNFLFSDKVLLAEGATDEIYVPLILQGLIERNRFEGDLNAFAIHSGLNESEMIGSANIYVREGRQVGVLVDGDEEGNKRKQRVEAWTKRTNRDCPVVSLSDFKPAPCSIEDFLESATFKEAVVSACKEAIEMGALQPKSGSWEADLKSQLANKENKSLGKRVEEILLGLFGECISDVWIARKYGDLLRADKPLQGADYNSYWQDEILKRFANRIWSALGLPLRGDVQGISFHEN